VRRDKAALSSGCNEDQKRGGIACAFLRLAHDRLETGGRLRIGIGRAPVLGDAECLERAEKKVFSWPDTMPMKRPNRTLASNVSALASVAPSSVKKLSGGCASASFRCPMAFPSSIPRSAGNGKEVEHLRVYIRMLRQKLEKDPTTLAIW
jgi:hypothetical protein